MKKFIAMMLCIVLTLSLVACGGNTEETTEATTEPTTETTTAATEETTEATEETTEPTEETTEEEYTEEEIEMYDFKFIERDAEYNENEIEPTETMLLLQSLYDNYPQDQRPSPIHVRVLPVEEYEINNIPTDIEGLEVVIAEPMMMAVAHFTSIITVPEGVDPQTVVDSIKAYIAANDPDLRNKWFCTSAETYELAVSGNQVLFIMTDLAFAEHCVNAFNAQAAG